MNTYSEQLQEDYETLDHYDAVRLYKQHGWEAKELHKDLGEHKEYSTESLLAHLGY